MADVQPLPADLLLRHLKSCPQLVTKLLDLLDAAQVRLYVDLDGGWGEEILHQHLDHFGRF